MGLIALARLELELARWRGLGQRPALWWRDDDARAPGPALDRLLALAGDLPLTLAVIPDGPLDDLARRLDGEANVCIAQHGVDHVNRRGPGGAPNEHELGAPVQAVAARIAVGHARMTAAGLPPLAYVPPWNAVDEVLAAALHAAGATLVSASDRSGATPGLRRVDASLDILRWRGGARFRRRGRVLGALRRQLAERRRAGAFERPVGLLTHHLVHDAAAWAFIAWLTAYSRDRFRWLALETLAA